MADGSPLIDFNNYIGGEEALATAARATRSLKKDIADLSKSVADDSGRIKAGFAVIGEAVKAIEGRVGGLKLVSDADTKLIQDYARQIAGLRAAKEDLQRTEQAQRVLQQGLSDTTKQYTSALNEQKAALKAAALAGDVAGQQKAAAAIRQTALETTQLSKALRGANSELTAAKGSYDALTLENNKLLASLHALEGGLNSGSQEAGRLKKQIFDNTQTLKDFDEQTNRNFRSVGDYKSGFSSLVAELAKARAAQMGLAKDSAEYGIQQQRITGFQTAAQKSAAQMGLSYEQAEARIAGATAAVQPLTTALVRLEKEQQDVAKSAGVDSEAYRKLGFQIASTKKNIDDLPASTEKAGGGFKNLQSQLGLDKQGLLGAVVQLGAGFLGVQAIFSGAGAAFSADSEFQSALSSLSALTGATGEDLQFMADKAQELGPKVGKSASDVLKAFELIGSAQPALLDSKENLAAVTEQALLLAAAAGTELPAAAEALTGVMNQFQAPAAEAARYVNALAAGAKEGAATISQSAESLKYFGVNAASANISVEKSVALIQTLAERSIKGEQAGTQLRAVLAKLASGAKETNPEVVGLATALDNLSKRSLTTAQYTKLFGLENANTAKVLVSSRDEIEKLTVAVTGTQVANEQAAKQLDNIRTSSSRFFEVLKNGVINTLDPFTRGVSRFLNQVSSLVGSLSGVTKSNQENTAATLAGAVANEATAASAQKLLSRYEELTAKGVKPTKEGKLELNAITLALRDSLGESVTSIDKETGALVLNEEATRSLIKQKLLLSNQAVSTLILEADALKDRQKQEQLDIKATELQIQTRERLLGLTREQAQAQVDDFVNNQGYGVLNKDVERLSKSTYDLSGARQQLAKTTADYNAKLEALGKLGAKQDYLDGVFTGSGAAADAQKKLAAATEGATVILDRDAKARAALRRSDLQGQLVDTQQRIADIKKLQAEQGKLFDDKQLSPEVFRASVATTQDQITALERKASATRIGILRAERDEKLFTVRDEAVKASKVKGVGGAELADIEAASATKQLEVVRQFSRDVKKERAALQDALEVKPVEFKVAAIDPRALEKAEKELLGALKINQKTYEETVELARNTETAKDSALLGALGRREITQGQYEARARQNRKEANDKILQADKDFHKANLEDQRKANQDILDDQQAALAKRLNRIDKISQYTQEAEYGYSQIRGNLIDAEIQRTQAAYDSEAKAAGDNAELKAQIDKKYQKQLAKLNYDKAKQEQNAAVVSIAISTAVGIAKAFAEYTFPFALIPAGIALAQGLLQEAVVLSKPLPAYFRGRTGGPAERAIVGDGAPELIHRARTKRFEYVAEQAVVQLEAHDRVLTGAQTSALLATVGLTHQQAQQPAQVAAAFGGAAQGAATAREAAGGKGLDKLAQNIDANTEALRRLKTTTVNVHRGADADVATSNSLTRYRSQRTFGRG